MEFDNDYYDRLKKAIKGKWKNKTIAIDASVTTDPDKLIYHLKKWNSEREGWQNLIIFSPKGFTVEPIIDWDGTFPPGFWAI